MIEIVPFRVSHLETLTLQTPQSYLGSALPSPESLRVLEGGLALSLLAGGTCLGCGGVAPVWAGYGKAWALLSRGIGPHLLRATKAAHAAMWASSFRRIEATSDVGFVAASRWLEMLGFQRYADRPQKGYHPSGLDVWFYAWVRP